ncbi:uncharacterized protein LOC106154280 [Lingula anatina]|uniref:Uncharacterized protein LOC106154280 n=1 Tax=Lingula anatina TaxID=7574 RepID=A0A1S3HDF0_LINAN|nr:uncharacterized protein LOC106154280 [Lingula anatina]|eukprot:XP_013384045.1 uncharacterized protein LOC106154280 [Lingula anatina]
MAMKRRYRKILLALLVYVFCATFAFHFRKEIFSDIIPAILHDLQFSVFEDQDGECDVPRLDPYHPSIKHLLRQSAPLVCDMPWSRPLTYIKDGCLYVNTTEMKASWFSRTETCSFQYIKRVDNSDFKVHFEAEIKFNLKKCHRLKSDDTFVKVTCYGEKKNDVTYTNYHAYITYESDRSQMTDSDRSVRTNNSGTRESGKLGFEGINESGSKRTYEKRNLYSNYGGKTAKTNVILFGMDSMSHSNFIRQFPRSRQRLLSFPNSVTFNGYNKVADNTLPNIIALLTGKTYEELTWTFGKYLDQFYHFDNFPFIWKHFAEKGFQTFYAEDFPGSTFTTGRIGFISPPTDYYMQPYWISLWNTELFNTSRTYCLGGKPRYLLLIEWLKDFLAFKQRNKEPFFSFSFLSEISHNDHNDARMLDAGMESFLDFLSNGGYLNDTLVVLFSDHGIRWGKVRETFVGKLEDRLPLMSIVIPESLTHSYPEILRNLKHNAEVLTTPFDVHATIAEVLDPDNIRTASADIYKSAVSRGMSLFKKIPKSRTCSQAGVETHWCTCSRRTAVSPDSALAPNVSKAVIGYINGLLTSNNLSACSLLKLSEIHELFKIGVNAKVLRFRTSTWYGNPEYNDKATKEPFQDYMITLSTRPGGGKFEATVRYDVTRNSFNVTSDVSRLNAFGSHGDCIKLNILKKFCFCKDLVKNKNRS